MGTQPVGEYCREIETYLTRKNDGHLIRIVGPSFDIVSSWAAQGVPVKVACEGIDRYFERYYRKGARRRPVKIDFCEHDVLDVFDEWRAALGLVSAESSVVSRQSPVSHPSLPEHLGRVLRRLSEARANGTLGDAFDALIDRVSTELDAARAKSGGLRGEARQALLDRLVALDTDILMQVEAGLDADTRAAIAREADAELAPFRGGMAADALTRARGAAVERLVRERARLPVIAFH